MNGYAYLHSEAPALRATHARPISAYELPLLRVGQLVRCWVRSPRASCSWRRADRGSTWLTPAARS